MSQILRYFLRYHSNVSLALALNPGYFPRISHLDFSQRLRTLTLLLKKESDVFTQNSIIINCREEFTTLIILWLKLFSFEIYQVYWHTKHMEYYQFYFILLHSLVGPRRCIVIAGITIKFYYTVKHDSFFDFFLLNTLHLLHPLTELQCKIKRLIGSLICVFYCCLSKDSCLFFIVF